MARIKRETRIKTRKERVSSTCVLFLLYLIVFLTLRHVWFGLVSLKWFNQLSCFLINFLVFEEIVTRNYG